MRTDIGTGSATALDMVHVSVDPKNTDSVIVNNLAGATLNYYSNLNAAPSGTIAAAAQVTFTTPVWIQSQGRSSVRLTGGKFGAW